MKISKSKQELARIISENGGWREGGFATQNANGDVRGFDCKPIWMPKIGLWRCDGDFYQWFYHEPKVKNYFQITISRAEYFHLYPAPDAKPRFCESVMRSIPEPEAKPTIEQLAADYRNAKDYAERKQQEADNAKAYADAKLKSLELAGEEIGLIVSPITTKQEPELVITDWRDLQVGDEVEARCHAGVLIGFITEVETKDYDGERPFRFKPFGESTRWCTSSEFKFIRRP